MMINGATATNNTAIPLTLTTTATGAIATATIVVTAGNGTTTKTYSIRIGVGRDAPSDDASLTNFVIDDFPLTAGTPTSISNTLRVWGADGSGTATVSYTLATGATIVSNPANPKPSDFASSNGVTYTVTAEDGTTTKTYTYKLTIASFSDGTPAKPYGIYNPAHLSDVRNGITASYKLMNDITLPDTNGYDNTADPAGMKIADYATNGWLPIGGTNPNTSFSGAFDGNGHVVSNLSIIATTANGRGTYTGLFSFVGYNGLIKNLGVATSNAGAVNTAPGSAGGNIGIIAGVCQGSVSSCYAKGKVSGAQVGGLVGSLNYQTGNSGNATNCYSICTVSSSGTFILGSSGLVFTGNNTASITNCYAASTVSSTTTNIAGIIALSGGVTISNCYWDTDLYTGAGIGGGGAQTGVTGETTTQMQTQATVTALNGSQTPKPWKLNSSGGYPKLSWEQ